jgi:hypothetical protein
MKTTSYELSKKLKKLGLHQDSYFYWINENKKIYYEGLDYEKNPIAAFTLDEILEMLPHYIARYNLHMRCTNQRYEIGYFDINDIWLNLLIYKFDKNPAEAAGQLLVWCIEHGYVKPELIGESNEND